VTPSGALANILVESGFWIALSAALLATAFILLKRLFCWLGSVIAAWVFANL
jgi:membrane protein implicated in regulation of membrane protease activity